MSHTDILCRRSLRFPIFLSSLALSLLSGMADDLPEKAVSQKSSSSGVGVKVLLICLGLVAVVSFSVFLFKIWQKKKREEQHARLLKLFEDDDELEVELGIRD